MLGQDVFKSLNNLREARGQTEPLFNRYFNVAAYGNLGIGTATPQRFFEINTNNSHLNFDCYPGSAGEPTIWLTGTEAPSTANWIFRGTDNNTRVNGKATWGLYFDMGGVNNVGRIWPSGGLSLGSYDTIDPGFENVLLTKVKMKSNTTAPIGADLGVNGGGIWVSNHFLYYTYSTDGSAVTTVKIAP